jgi:heme/copper-type cytochrome/quinol oxidase subunit 4
MAQSLQNFNAKYNDILNVIIAIAIVWVLFQDESLELSAVKALAIINIFVQFYRFLNNKSWLNS